MKQTIKAQKSRLTQYWGSVYRVPTKQLLPPPGAVRQRFTTRAGSVDIKQAVRLARQGL